MSLPSHKPTVPYRPPPRGLAHPADDFWPELGIRIALAGAFYPVIVVGAWGSLALLIASPEILSAGESGIGEVLYVVVASSIVAPFLWGVGFFYAGFVTTLTLPCLAVVLRLMGERPPRDTAGLIAGTSVAALSTLPLSMAVAWNVGSGDTRAAVVVFLHVLLAIVLGQAAGRLAGVRDLRRRRRGRLGRRPFRFTVWRLLAAMVPMSIVLSLLSLGDMMTPAFAVASALAIGGALLTRKPVTWTVNQWLDRRLRKRREKRRTLNSAADIDVLQGAGVTPAPR